MIAYKYIVNDSILKNSEMTGIMEDEDYLYVHPPRNYLDVLEYCPFPELPMPILRKMEWETHGSIYDGFNLKPWGYMDKLPNAYHTKKYQIVKDTSVNILNQKMKCYIINGQFFDENLKFLSRAQFFFNEKYGFVFSDYYTMTGHRIMLSLKKRKKL